MYKCDTQAKWLLKISHSCSACANDQTKIIIIIRSSLRDFRGGPYVNEIEFLL